MEGDSMETPEEKLGNGEVSVASAKKMRENPEPAPTSHRPNLGSLALKVLKV